MQPEKARSPDIAHARFLHCIPEIAREYRGYRERQYSRASVLARQRLMLQSCLRSAFRTVPEFYDRGVIATEIEENPYEVLFSLPRVQKTDLQDRFENFISDQINPGNCFGVRTSGSTGIPLEIIHDSPSLIHEAASLQRVFDAIGFLPGDRIARVVSDRSRPMWKQEIQLLYGPFEVAVVNLLDSEQNWSESSIENLYRWDPSGLIGNPADLAALAGLVDPRKLKHLKYILPGGENLTGEIRRTIDQTFGARIFDIYSMREIPLIAWQCEAGAMHVDEDRVIVEERERGVNGGELVVTHLCNQYMPLMRYCTADYGRLVSWESMHCTCGRELSTIQDFQGRDRGFVVLGDGRPYSPKPIKLFLTGLSLRSWQLNQDKVGVVEVLIEPIKGEEPEGLKRIIEDQLHRLLGRRLEAVVTVCSSTEFRRFGQKLQMMNLRAFKQQRGAKHG